METGRKTETDKPIEIPEKEEKNPLDKLVSAIAGVTNWLEFARNFVRQEGIWYDNVRNWWVWDKTDYCWRLVDETDIFNKIDEALQNQPQTLQNNIKTQIIEALRRQSRLNKPKEPKSTWVQFKNKIIDIDTENTFDSTSDYFFTNPLPWELGETEDTPVLDKLFKEWVGEELAPRLYEIIAFCLSPQQFIHRIFVFTGSGSNGKTKFLLIIENLIGKNNICSSDLDLLCESRFELSNLFKKLVCVMGETNFTTIKRTNTLKRLSGEDLISFEFKHKDKMNAKNTAKILIATNTLPITEDRTKGFYRRWVITSFPNEFPETEDVLERVPEIEYNNLAKKSIKILRELRKKRKFYLEGTIQDREKAYEEKSNPLTSFIAEYCSKDHNSELPLFRFHDEYSLFLDKRGHRKQTKHEVRKALEQQEGFETGLKDTLNEEGNPTKWRYIYGLKLKKEIGDF